MTHHSSLRNTYKCKANLQVNEFSTRQIFLMPSSHTSTGVLLQKCNGNVFIQKKLHLGDGHCTMALFF